MKQTLALFVFLALTATCPIEPQFMAGNSAITPLPAVSSRATGSGLRFERNAGQFPEGSEFGVRTGPQAVAFSHGGIDFGQGDGSAGVRMRWLGGAADVDFSFGECGKDCVPLACEQDLRKADC